MWYKLDHVKSGELLIHFSLAKDCKDRVKWSDLDEASRQLVGNGMCTTRALSLDSLS